MTSAVSDYLKYANLQMAAEALFGQKGKPAGSIFSGVIDIADLKTGNERSSKFTDVLAQQFSNDWAVVEHISNTTTGFSGTLFRARQDDPSLGIKTGDLVLSFRSTEFADDNVRDSKATNELEIQKFGWAFGQIDDMEQWYASLQSRGLIDRPFAVTGYTLGAHLATAFTLLRQEQGQSSQITSTYTFNGAGVGELAANKRLTDIVADFHARRYGTEGNQITFTDPTVQNLYSQLRTRLIGGVGPTSVDLYNANQRKSLASAHGDDHMEGGDGADMMARGGGDDEMDGGAGNDQLQSDDVGANLDIGAHGMVLLDGGIRGLPAIDERFEEAA